MPPPGRDRGGCPDAGAPLHHRRAGRELDVTTRAIRFYEAQGATDAGPPRRRSAPTRAATGRGLMLILRGKNLGFCLEDVAQYLKLYDADPAQMAQTQLLLEKVEHALADLHAKRADLDRTLRELKDIRGRCLEHLQRHRAGRAIVTRDAFPTKRAVQAAASASDCHSAAWTSTFHDCGNAHAAGGADRRSGRDRRCSASSLARLPDDARAGRRERMPDRDATSPCTLSLARSMRAERRVPAELRLAVVRILPGLQRAQHLRGERFVDLVEVEVLQLQPGALEHLARPRSSAPSTALRRATKLLAAACA